MITYDSGANGPYISKTDRVAASLPICCPSTKGIGVANDSTSSGTYATPLPFSSLSHSAAAADSFAVPHSLMSVGKTADDSTISIFTKDGVTIHKESDVLITCQGKPILLGVHDRHS
jgi:hypothetical protein